MDPFAPFAVTLLAKQVRFVMIGVAGANYYARSGGTIFTTEDRDLFLPLARLTDIVNSKANTGRDKDRLFLATHEEALRQMMGEDDAGGD